MSEPPEVCSTSGEVDRYQIDSPHRRSQLARQGSDLRGFSIIECSQGKQGIFCSNGLDLDDQAPPAVLGEQVDLTPADPDVAIDNR